MRRSYRFEVALDISNVSTAAAARVAGRDINHMLVETFLVKDAIADDFEAFDVSAFFEYSCGCWRHRPRENAANVSMVASRSSEEDNIFAFGIKNRRDYGDIREMPFVQQLLVTLSLYANNSRTTHVGRVCH